MPRKKKSAVEGLAIVPAPTNQQDAAQVEPARMTYADRENPSKLSGDDLKALAHQRGMPKSSVATMSDVKIREQLAYITVRQGEEEAA